MHQTSTVGCYYWRPKSHTVRGWSTSFWQCWRACWKPWELVRVEKQLLRLWHWYDASSSLSLVFLFNLLQWGTVTLHVYYPSHSPMLRGELIDKVVNHFRTGMLPNVSWTHYFFWSRCTPYSADFNRSGCCPESHIYYLQGSVVAMENRLQLCRARMLRMDWQWSKNFGIVWHLKGGKGITCKILVNAKLVRFEVARDFMFFVTN